VSEYKFTLTKVICGDLVEGRIHLGLGVSVDSRVSLVGIESYATRLDKSVSDEKERVRRRELGLKSKKRLKEILQRGKAQPEGLYIKIFSYNEIGPVKIIGDIKYIYARDLYNNQPGQNPWTGWQGASGQLLKEELVNHSSL
tara:strand:- start:153 stop:578 length:426 start_codon:yes stop_codon:yes gene_type:complete